MEGLPKTYAWPRLILFGDSLTQMCFSPDGCWGSLLADKLQRKCDVLNRGLAGWNTRWNRAVLPRIFPDKQSLGNVAGFVIFLGANDSNNAEINAHQHVPVDEYKSNLKAMVQYLESLGLVKDKILIVGPSPCEVGAWGKRLQERGNAAMMGKDNAVIPAYNEKCKEVANETGVDFLDIYTSMMSADNWPSYLVDGLHFSTAGSTLFYQLLLPWIEKREESLSFILPEWNEVNSTSPGESF